MRRINEHVTVYDISDFLNEQLENQELNEGVKDWARNAIKYLKSKVVKMGEFFAAFWNDKILPAISPITAQIALKLGNIKNQGAISMMGNSEDAKLSGITTSGDEILSKRPSTLNALRLAKQKFQVKESQEEKLVFQINEEFLDTLYQTDRKALLEAVKLTHPDTKAFAKLNIDANTLKAFIKAALRKPTGTPLLIWGAPGIGKTAIVNSVLKEVGAEGSRLIDVQLSQMNPDDFMLPDYKLDAAGNRIGATDIPKTWLPVYKPTGNKEEDEAADKATGGGVLFFDELSRAKPQVMNVCLKLINERKLGADYRIGSGWAIIAASNRFEDDPSTNNELSTALGNRFKQVNYAPTFKSWRGWAQKQKYISPFILDWLELNEKYFYLLEDTETTLFPSPRSWDLACQGLCEMAGTGLEEGFDIESIDMDLIEVVIASAVGSEAATGFCNYLKLRRTLNVDALTGLWTKGLKGVKKEGIIPPKDRSDLGYMAVTTVCSAMDHEPTKEEFDYFIDWLIMLDNETLMARALKLICAMFPPIENKLTGKGNDPEKDKYLPSALKLVKAYPEFDKLNIKDVFN